MTLYPYISGYISLHKDNAVANKSIELFRFYTTVKILCIGTDRSRQTVQTLIRLLLKKQSDQGLRCLHCISFFWMH